MIALDPDWNVTYINAAAARLVDTREVDLLGRNIWEEYPQSVGTIFQERFQEAVDTQQVVEFEEYYDHVDPVRAWVSVRAYPSAGGLTVVFRDVTHLRALTDQRRALLDRLVEAEERERARIAAGVHDDSVQALGVVHLRLQLLRGRADEGPTVVESILEGLDVVVAEAIDRLRGLLFSLEPTDVDLPLVDSVRSVAAHIFGGTQVRWSVDADDGVEELDRPERTQAVRIVKEALHNVRVHAGATQVGIRIAGRDGGVQVEVTDDGTATDPSTFTSAPGHRGLATMRDRAEVVGGRLELEAAEPHGCTVRLFVPTDPQW